MTLKRSRAGLETTPRILSKNKNVFYDKQNKNAYRSLWKSMKEIVQDAVLKYTLSACRSKKEAARFLGIRRQNFNQLILKKQLMLVLCIM